MTKHLKAHSKTSTHHFVTFWAAPHPSMKPAASSISISSKPSQPLLLWIHCDDSAHTGNCVMFWLNSPSSCHSGETSSAEGDEREAVSWEKHTVVLANNVFVNLVRRMGISGPWLVSSLFPDAICSPATHFLPCECMCLCVNKRMHLTQSTPVARHCHEGPQGATDDAVRATERGLFEGASVLVQEGVHAVGSGRAAIPHEGLWNTTCQNSVFLHQISTVASQIVEKATSPNNRAKQNITSYLLQSLAVCFSCSVGKLSLN